MKISKFCWGVELSDAARFLAKYGMVLSVLWFAGGTIMLVNPMLPIQIDKISYGITLNGKDLLDQKSYYTSYKSSLTNFSLYTEAAVSYGNMMIGISCIVLFISIGWLLFSFLMHKKNKNNDQTGVNKMIMIGSTLIGCFQTMMFCVWISSGTYELIHLSILRHTRGVDMNMNILPEVIIIVGGLWIIVSFLLLFGIRKRSPRIIKLWIIFDFVLVFSFSLFCFIFSLFNGFFIITVLLLIAFFLTCVYNYSMVIVHYNIILEEQQILQSALENFSHENNSKIDKTGQMDDLPPLNSHVM